METPREVFPWQAGCKYWLPFLHSLTMIYTQNHPNLLTLQKKGRGFVYNNMRQLLPYRQFHSENIW